MERSAWDMMQEIKTIVNNTREKIYHTYDRRGHASSVDMAADG